jgi:hypothetical protein
MTAVIVSFEIGGGSFAAKIAIDALVIDVKLSVYIFRIFISGVGHKSLSKAKGKVERNAGGAKDFCWASFILLWRLLRLFLGSLVLKGSLERWSSGGMKR